MSENQSNPGHGEEEHEPLEEPTIPGFNEPDTAAEAAKDTDVQHAEREAAELHERAATDESAGSAPVHRSAADEHDGEAAADWGAGSAASAGTGAAAGAGAGSDAAAGKPNPWMQNASHDEHGPVEHDGTTEHEAAAEHGGPYGTLDQEANESVSNAGADTHIGGDEEIFEPAGEEPAQPHHTDNATEASAAGLGAAGIGVAGLGTSAAGVTAAANEPSADASSTPETPHYQAPGYGTPEAAAAPTRRSGGGAGPTPSGRNWFARNKALAITLGVIIVIIIVVLAILIPILAGAGSHGKKTSGATFRDWSTGDCLQGMAGPNSSANIVDCTKGHNAQVLKSYTYPADQKDYPSANSLESKARDVCLPALDQAKAQKYKLDMEYVAPDPNSWKSGLRDLLCVAKTGDSSNSLTVDLTK